jgi:hypothetical protein
MNPPDPVQEPDDMGYAIFCQNHICPKWEEFPATKQEPSKWARFKNLLGFTAGYDEQVAEIQRLSMIDPAQEDINWWVEKWKLPADAFKGRPSTVDLPATKRRVSEVYDSKDLCSTVFDLKFATQEARNSSEWGSKSISRVHEHEQFFWDIVAFTYNEFTIEEVEV